MRKVVLLIMIISNLCTPDSEEFKLLAEVRGVDEKIEVEVIRSQYASGTYLMITSDKTKISDSDGRKLTRADISVGDILEITYGGEVMLSYPPQTVAHRIVRKK